ncbi:hypothetical protein [Acinetobacter sp.]|uniref:hypothetical protein n=1 Tax=Acinetobacter sp. TaxID=472 RepID=UPI00388F0D54
MIYFSIITTITAISILAGLLYGAIKRGKNKLVNLDRTRANLAAHEQKNDELQHELNTFCAETGTLSNKVEKLSRYQAILDIEQYVAERQNQVENFVEVSKT